MAQTNEHMDIVDLRLNRPEVRFNDKKGPLSEESADEAGNTMLSFQ